MKQLAPTRRTNIRMKKAILSFFTGLLLLFFGWTTKTATSAHLPEAGAPTAIYASENQDDLRNIFSTAIKSAKNSVVLVIYTLTDRSIIQALKEKAAQGIQVDVIVDAKASPKAAKQLGSQINTIRRLGKGLMHRKILVIDKEFAWIGSANMTADSLQMHSNQVLAIHSPSLVEYLLKEINSTTEYGRGAPLPHQEFNIGGQQVEFCFLPDDALYGLKRIKELIRGAKKTIRIAMFTWTRNDFAHEIIRAANRGIDVQVVIDHNSGKGASEKIVQLLKKNGVNVHLSKGPGLLHHKFMIVDKKALVTGSANWTKAAFTANEDCFLVLEPLNAKQIENLDSEWSFLFAESEAG